MKKTSAFLAILCLAMPVHADSRPASAFFSQQLEQLKNFKATSERGNSFDERVQATPSTPEPSAEQWHAKPAVAQPPSTLSIRTPEDFTRAALTLAPEAEKQKQMLAAARYNLSQTQALELLLNQFSAFMSQTPSLTPLFKEHPFPGVSAIKGRIAQSISAEASARFDHFLAGFARQSRTTAYQIIAARKRLALLDRTIELYADLKKTSDTLYRNGKISFAELTMISLEASRLETQKNQYQTILTEQQEKAFALLGGRRPALNFGALPAPDFISASQISDHRFSEHPALLAENIGLKRLEDSIALVQRMTFPEYTSTSRLPMKKNISTAASAVMLQADSRIEFNRTFVEQLKARRQAQAEAVTATRLMLQAQYASDLEAFQRNHKTMQVIRSRMLPELEKAFTSVKSKYESGQANFQQLVETEKRLLNLKEKLIDSEFATLKTRADMLYDLGKIQY
ncbi:MAG: TolC family protein [Candidatus Riflebacteria bacterium]|nr:TolC family protein [Candidatus Riflebacteria bacterium]